MFASGSVVRTVKLAMRMRLFATGLAQPLNSQPFCMGNW